jgi:hypothetical protein
VLVGYIAGHGKDSKTAAFLPMRAAVRRLPTIP